MRSRPRPRKPRLSPHEPRARTPARHDALARTASRPRTHSPKPTPRQRSARTPASLPAFTLAIPTHNEAHRIARTLGQLAAFKKNSGLAFRVLVVDDGTDATAALAKKTARALGLPLDARHFPRRLGKGGAVKKALERATNTVILYDADASTPPHEIPKLLHALEANDVAIGSRYAPGAAIRGRMPLDRLVASRTFNLLVRLLLGLPHADTQCGFKAFTARAARLLGRELQATGFEFDAELLARAQRHGYRVVEVPIEWRHEKGGTASVTAAPKMLAGLLAVKKRLGIKSVGV